MRLGAICALAGVVSLVATIWMLANGTMFLHGFIVFLFLALFGLYLIKRSRQLTDIKRWAKEHPEEAKAWLDTLSSKEAK